MNPSSSDLIHFGGNHQVPPVGLGTRKLATYVRSWDCCSILSFRMVRNIRPLAVGWRCLGRLRRSSCVNGCGFPVRTTRSTASSRTSSSTGRDTAACYTAVPSATDRRSQTVDPRSSGDAAVVLLRTGGCTRPIPSNPTIHLLTG